MLSFEGISPPLVAKTIPRPLVVNKEPTRISTRVWLWVAVTSYSTCALSLWSVFICGGSENHSQNVARLRGEVPEHFLEWPMSAFAAVLVLNVLNLALRQNATKFRTNLLLLFINGVAFTTDLLINLELTPVFQATNGRMFHPLRYLQWSHSTPTLIYMIWLSSDPEEVEASQLMYAVVNDVVMILTGLAATCSSGSMQIFWAFVSFATFFAVLITVYKMFRSNIDNMEDSEARGIVSVVLYLMMGLWNLFPVVWLLAELHLISPAAEQLCWGICDYAAKAVFVSQLWQSNIASVYERREAALRTWEESNRTLVIDRLQKLVEERERLANVIGHELRTPVLGIMALSGSLMKDVQQRLPLNLKHLSMIKSSSAFLNNLINTSLEMATGKDKKPQAAHEAVYMYELVEEVCTLIRPLVREGVSLHNTVPSEIPPVEGDRTRLMQVLFNLVGNASRFTMHGSIHVRARILDNYIEISVEDTGIGVAQEDLEAIFQPYVSLTPDMAASCGGSGLGLYLVKLALDGHSADINVESEVGKGSAFHFSLPIASDELVARSPKPALPPRFASRHGSRQGSRNTSKRSLLLSPRPSILSSPGSQEQSDTHMEPRKPRSTDNATQPGLPIDHGELKTVIEGSGIPVNVKASEGAKAAEPNAVEETVSEEAAAEALATLAEALQQQEASARANKSRGADGQGFAKIKPFHRHINGCFQIMIVDDDVISQVVAEQVVRSQKWKVVKAGSGKQCLDYISSTEVLPDLILLDNRMPGPTGCVVCQQLRAMYPPSELAVIIVSVRMDEGDAAKALNVGADDYVSKPYKRSELVARIKAQLRVRDTMAMPKVLEHLSAPATSSSRGRSEEPAGSGSAEAPRRPEQQPPATSAPARALMYNNAMVVVVRLLGLEQRLPLAHVTAAPGVSSSVGGPSGHQHSKSQQHVPASASDAAALPSASPHAAVATAAAANSQGVIRLSDSGWPHGCSNALHQAETAACACSTMQQLLHHMHHSSIATAYMQLSATTAAVVVPMGTERQPSVAIPASVMSEQDEDGSMQQQQQQSADVRHAVFGLAVSLLKTVSQAQWPDSTAMQACCVMHGCPAKLMPLPYQHSQDRRSIGGGAGAECVLPMLPATEVLLSLGARGFPGCVVATQSAYELLSSAVRWLPWMRSLEAPLDPSTKASSRTFSSRGQVMFPTASGGLGPAAAATAVTPAPVTTMGGGPQHLTQAQLYVAEAQGLQYAAALAHAEAVQITPLGQRPGLPPSPQPLQQPHAPGTPQPQSLAPPLSIVTLPQQLRQPQLQGQQQMDASQHQALQRVQQQRVKGRRLSVGPLPSANTPFDVVMSPLQPSRAPSSMPVTARANQTTPNLPIESLAPSHAALPSSPQLGQQPQRKMASDTSLAVASSVSAAMLAAPGPVAGPAGNSSSNGNSGDKAAAEALFGGRRSMPGTLLLPQPPAPAQVLLHAAHQQPPTPPPQQQQRVYAQIQAAMTEREMLRVHCKELETENCMLQHRLVDARAAQNSAAMDRDLYRRLVTDAGLQWQSSKSMLGVHAVGSGNSSGGVLLLNDPSVLAASTTNHQPQQKQPPDARLEQQLEQLRGEAAAMRQEMAAALPTSVASQLLKPGSPSADRSTSRPKSGPGSSARTPLFSSRRHSMLNLGALLPSGGSPLSPRSSSITMQAHSPALRLQPAALRPPPAPSAAVGGAARGGAASHSLPLSKLKRFSSMPSLVQLGLASGKEDSMGDAPADAGGGTAAEGLLHVGHGPSVPPGGGTGTHMHASGCGNPALSHASTDGHALSRGTGGEGLEGVASRESSMVLMPIRPGPASVAERAGSGSGSSGRIIDGASMSAAAAVAAVEAGPGTGAAAGASMLGGGGGAGVGFVGPAMALGGRSERFMGHGGGSSSSGQVQSLLSRRATPPKRSPSSITHSTSPVAGSPEVPSDTAVHKLKQLFKHKKPASKDALLRSNTTGKM